MKSPTINRTLLHACCGPCLTVPLERRDKKELVVFWFNPNIEPAAEHSKRLRTLKQLQSQIPFELISDYDYEKENRRWHEAITGLENEKEGGKRCKECIKFRFVETHKKMEELGLDGFETTLSVSRHKSTSMINKIGKLISDTFIENNFKLRGGDNRSIELSRQYRLYRQKYCGCGYSNPKNRLN